MTAVNTCATCHREIVNTPNGWSDGVRANPTVCIASPVLAHAPAMAVAG